jgi:hypothetical protein
MSRTVRIARCTLALAGAWLPILFSSAVLLPQRIEAIVGDPSWSASYAAVSATGWASVILGLTLSGRLQDRGRFARSGDRRTVPLLALTVLIAGSSLTFATTLPTLTALWVATLLPCALCVTVLAARAAECSAVTSDAASAIGSAPVLSMLLGAVAVTLAQVTGAARFVLIAGLAAAAMTAGAATTQRPTRDAALPIPPSSAVPQRAHSASVADPAVRRSIRQHRRLLVAVALVDTATVTFTFSIVPLVFLLTDLPHAFASTPGGYAELLVLLATACALCAVWVAPRLPGLRTRPRVLFLLTGLLSAACLVTSPFSGALTLLAVVLLAGCAIGASNAATFALFLDDPVSSEQRATGLGLLNAMPSLPAALVPAVATVLLRWSPELGLTTLLVVSASTATVGALSIVRHRSRPVLRASRSPQGSHELTSPQ